MIGEIPLRCLVTLQSLVRSVRRDERGQDTLEWVLMSVLLAAGIVGLLVLLTPFLTTMVGNVGECLDFDAITVCTPGF